MPATITTSSQQELSTTTTLDNGVITVPELNDVNASLTNKDQRSAMIKSALYTLIFILVATRSVTSIANLLLQDQGENNENDSISQSEMEKLLIEINLYLPITANLITTVTTRAPAMWKKFTQGGWRNLVSNVGFVFTDKHLSWSEALFAWPIKTLGVGSLILGTINNIPAVEKLIITIIKNIKGDEYKLSESAVKGITAGAVLDSAIGAAGYYCFTLANIHKYAEGFANFMVHDLLKGEWLKRPATYVSLVFLLMAALPNFSGNYFPSYFALNQLSLQELLIPSLICGSTSFLFSNIAAVHDLVANLKSIVQKLWQRFTSHPSMMVLGVIITINSIIDSYYNAYGNNNSTEITLHNDFHMAKGSPITTGTAIAGGVFSGAAYGIFQCILGSIKTLSEIAVIMGWVHEYEEIPTAKTTPTTQVTVSAETGTDSSYQNTSTQVEPMQLVSKCDKNAGGSYFNKSVNFFKRCLPSFNSSATPQLATEGNCKRYLTLM